MQHWPVEPLSAVPWVTVEMLVPLHLSLLYTRHHCVVCLFQVSITGSLVLFQGQERTNFSLQLSALLHTSSLSNQGRNSSRQGTWRQELKQKLWRGTVHWLAQSNFLYNWEEPPAQGWHHSGLSHPTSIMTQEYTPKVCPRANLMKALSQPMLPLPKWL